MNEEIIQNINERLDLALTKARTMIEDEDFQERVRDLKNQAETAVRDNPVKSVIIGFGVGFLLAKLFNSED